MIFSALLRWLMHSLQSLQHRWEECCQESEALLWLNGKEVDPMTGSLTYECKEGFKLELICKYAVLLDYTLIFSVVSNWI